MLYNTPVVISPLPCIDISIIHFQITQMLLDQKEKKNTEGSHCCDTSIKLPVVHFTCILKFNYYHF